MIDLSITAEDLLRSYGVPSLQQMARGYGIDPKGHVKAQLVEILSRTLYDPVRIRASLDDLTPNERDVLDRLIFQGGHVPTMLLHKQLEAAGVIDPAPDATSRNLIEEPGSVTKRGSTKFQDIVARLGVLGLVFTVAPSEYYQKVEFREPSAHLIIPAQIMAHVPTVAPLVETVPQPPVVREAPIDALHRDVYTLLSIVWDEPVAVTTQDAINKRSLVRIDESMRVQEGAAGVRSESELSRLPLLRRLAEEIGLILPSGGALHISGEVDAFLALSRGERAQRLFDAYRRTTRWSELSLLHTLSITPRTEMAQPRVTAARQRVLTEVTELPVGQWFAVSHVVNRIHVRDHEFMLSRDWDSYYPYYGYSMSRYYEPYPYETKNDLRLRFSPKNAEKLTWDTVEGGFIRAVITEALFWLGIVDLGTTGEDGPPFAFRLTPLGVLLLAGKIPPSVVPDTHVVIQPNFQILAFEPTGEDVLYALDRFAKRVRAENVVEYQLTRESVYAAQRHGTDAAAILQFLDRVDSTPLPQNVRRSIQEWGAQHDRIVVRRNVSAIHALDEATLDSLHADPELKDILGQRLAPTVTLVPLSQLDSVYRHLVDRTPTNRHPLPALSEGNDTQWRPSTCVDREGRVYLQGKLPSIYVLHALRSFADEEPDGTLRLTPDSLRRAARAKRTPKDIIQRLESLHIGPIPPEIYTLVQQWTKDLGRGTLVQTALLGVQSPDIMADLLGDAELGPYLTPIPGAPSLAVVPLAQVDHVRSVLSAHGMEFVEGLV